jgi:ferredoxin-NADP reductase/mono/diheme cytochrome c family protein
MLPVPLSAALGILFVLTGAAAVWLMFDASSRAPDSRRAKTTIAAHRIAGYLFTALFCVMTWFMVLRLRDGTDNLPLPSLLHTLIAIVLAPLIFVKILVARHYKKYTPILVPIGLTIFVLAFVLVVMAAGPYLLRTRAMRDVSLQAIDMGTARIDLHGSEALVQQRCSRCHTLDRVLGARKDAQGWLATVDRMRRLPGSGIAESEVKVILSYLLAENSIDSSSAPGALSVGKALVDSHCGRCHALDRIYESSKTTVEWDATVTRMVKYAHGTEGFFKPGEAEQIVRFLSATQTPEAVQTRAAAVPEAVPGARPAPKTESAERRVLTLPTMGVTVLIAGVFGILLRRPRTGLTRGKVAQPASIEPRTPPVSTHGAAMILQLVRSERQTHDCICLRFRIAGGAGLHFRPGQFLTFDWLIDGKKLVRCYSISSSPTQAGFVEITVKKQENGCVSPHLNERAAVGLTVEARGPFGQFHFNEQVHKKIVLFAGGSGITPMMSMLRYIDDLALDTQVTLFYSVRTRGDIVFAEELGSLQERLPGFCRVIVLTKPDDGWLGARGRIGRELIVQHLSETAGRTFFLCGPQGFMDHINGVLAALNVPLEKIMQESFGGIKTNVSARLEGEGSVGVVDFAGSGRTSTLSPGQTLLEAAEAAGVNIPSACRQGRCGTCAARLLAGDVQMASEEGLDPALKARGYVLTCVARAQGKVCLDA